MMKRGLRKVAGRQQRASGRQIPGKGSRTICFNCINIQKTGPHTPLSSISHDSLPSHLCASLI